MDTDSNTVELDDDDLLKFEVISNSEFITFLNSNGDTVKTNPPFLENILYSDVKNGKVKILAVKQNPDSIVNCNLKISLQEDQTAFGEKEAVVLEQTLKIIMEGDLEVKPIITGRRYDPEHSTYLNNITGDNRKPFRVEVTRGGKKIEKHSVRLKTNYIDCSGGHSHKTPRRPDSAFSYRRKVNGVWSNFNIALENARRQNYGSFYSYSSGNRFNTDSLKGMIFERSNEDTVSRFEYVASLWGDSMRVYLESLENILLNKDSVTIVEKIPDLVALGQGENYSLVGGTHEHHGPTPYEEDHNHFGTYTLNNALVRIAEGYSRLNPGVRIRINDMSLPYGGKFDINGSWKGSHAQHREGKNADISAIAINSDNSTHNVNQEQMRQIIFNATGINPLFHNPPHYHIYTE